MTKTLRKRGMERGEKRHRLEWTRKTSSLTDDLITYGENVEQSTEWATKTYLLEASLNKKKQASLGSTAGPWLHPHLLPLTTWAPYSATLVVILRPRSFQIRSPLSTVSLSSLLLAPFPVHLPSQHSRLSSKTCLPGRPQDLPPHHSLFCHHALFLISFSLITTVWCYSDDWFMYLSSHKVSPMGTGTHPAHSASCCISNIRLSVSGYWVSDRCQ